MKRLLSLLLSAILIIGILPAASFAAGEPLVISADKEDLTGLAAGSELTLTASYGPLTTAPAQLFNVIASAGMVWEYSASESFEELAGSMAGERGADQASKMVYSTAKIEVQEGTVYYRCRPNSTSGTIYSNVLAVTGIAAEPVQASVTVTAQAEGGFLIAPLKELSVKSDLAESYGYTDNVPKAENVSVLDVLVKAHEEAFGEDFTPETAGEYLAVGSTGYCTMLFGETTSANGFLVNGGYPNDGTESQWGGYNGTTLSTQIAEDEDHIDFYIYGDKSTWSDQYTYLEAPERVKTGSDIEVSVTGVSVMGGYNYLTPADMKAAANSVEGALLAWVGESGEVTPIENAATGEDGTAIIAAPKTEGDYLLTACTDWEDEDADVLLMNPVKIAVYEPAPVKAKVDYTAQGYGAFMVAPGFDVTVSSDLAESYGYTDQIPFDKGLSALDVLVKIHQDMFGDDFTPEAAGACLEVSESGFVSTIFGVDTGASGFLVDRGYPNDGTESQWGGYNGTYVNNTEVKEGSLVEFFIYQDTDFYLDCYTYTEAPESVLCESEMEVSVTGIYYMMGYEYLTPADMKAAAKPLEEIQLAWVDIETGEAEPIEDSETGEDGIAVIFAPQKAGTYWLTACGSDADDNPSIMTLTRVVVTSKPMTGVSAEDFELKVGETKVLEPVLEPENAEAEFTFASSDSAVASVAADGTVTAKKEGTAVITISAEDMGDTSNVVTTECTVTVYSVPTSITAALDIDRLTDCGYDTKNKKVVGANGSTFAMKAVDEKGSELTEVTWKLTKAVTGFSIDAQTGVVTCKKDIYSGDSAVSLSIQAVSKRDPAIVSKAVTVSFNGYKMKAASKNVTINLSEDGQTAQTKTISGGYSTFNSWSAPLPEGVAEWKTTPTTSTAASLNFFRPGSFEVTVTVNVAPALSDTAVVTVKGLAVEDSEGTLVKTYVDEKAETQLKACTEEGAQVTGWTSSDESVATVSETGLVTGIAPGSTIITASDSKGNKGGIKVVVESTTTPYFENIAFVTTSSDWVAGTYKPQTFEYKLTVPSKAVSLIVQNTTIYNTEKFDAEVTFVNQKGEEITLPVKSEGLTTLERIAFDESVMTMTIKDKEDPENFTTYTFNVTNLRDDDKTLKATTGLAVTPAARELTESQYNGKAEGTIFQADASGAPTAKTGASGSVYNYCIYLVGSDKAFKLNIVTYKEYAHIAYSTDGTTYTDLGQGSVLTDAIAFPEGEQGTETAKVYVKIIGDLTYCENVKAGKDGFAGDAANVYTIWIEPIHAGTADIAMLTAECSVGNAYPEVFDPEHFTYNYLVPNGTESAVLTYTVSEGASVTVGATAAAAGTAASPAEDGTYTLTLKTTAQYVNVSKDGVRKQYSFKITAGSKNPGYPDKVVDYLCINSQYSNVTYGIEPEATLSGGLKSLGNFGGYITYYYEKGIKNEPENKYGMDLYIYGNSMLETNSQQYLAFSEPGQVWVSEDGTAWYALAGSEHYQDGTDWNYSIDYTRTADGKTAWTDSLGNSNDGTTKSGNWVKSSIYYLNDLAKQDKISLTGIMLPSEDGTVTGSGSLPCHVKWGYVDALPNGTVGADTNPYVVNNYNLSAAGFDLEWAVDQDGMPVDVSGKEFHYVKVVTASNIWNSGVNEKSTEVSGVLRTVPQEAPVGRTAAPSQVVFTDGTYTQTVELAEGQQVYNVDLGAMSKVTASVEGADAKDNIYINNERLAVGEASSAMTVSNEADRLVRVVVQNGDKEPVICLFKLSSSAENTDLITGVKVTANSSAVKATTKDEVNYSASVSYRVDTVAIDPAVVSGAEVTINGEAPADSYDLEEGRNTFVIRADKMGVVEEITLVITRAEAPQPDGNTITVKFTLLGDDAHGEDYDKAHTLSNKNLQTWFEKTYTVASPAYVLDIFEMAMDDGNMTYVNSGNYVSSITRNGVELAEFTNGVNSGWMYTLNGKYPKLGIAEQKLKNRDVIVFHYTDDYTLEDYGGEDFMSSASGADSDFVVKNAVVVDGTPANGQIKPSVKNASKGETVTITVTPDAGYELDQLTVTDSKGNEIEVKKNADGTYSFTMPAGKVNVEASFKKAQTKNNFTDVKSTDYFYEPVLWALENGVTDGVDAEHFAPAAVTTRGQLITFLWRAAGCPEPKRKDVPFGDLVHGSYYEKAALWAVEMGITEGTSETAFSPDAPVTRAQAVTFLYRMEGFDTLELKDNPFSDVEEGTYYYDAVLWAAKQGITDGTSETTFSPSASLTRGQSVTFLYRFMNR